MDIGKLSLNELIDLQKKIPAEIEKRKSEDLQKLRAELDALANSRGFKLEEIVQGAAPAKATGRKAITVKIKYRHPANSELTWTGRGKQPRWVAAWKEQNGNLDGLLVA